MVKPFPNNRVTLDATGSGGLFAANRDRNRQFLASYPAGNILHLFRQNAGLPAPGSATGNWDVANGNLRGHHSGHFMSALALAYAGGAGGAYKTKLDAIVSGMADCQAALAAAAALPLRASQGSSAPRSTSPAAAPTTPETQNASRCRRASSAAGGVVVSR